MYKKVFTKRILFVRYMYVEYREVIRFLLHITRMHTCTLHIITKRLFNSLIYFYEKVVLKYVVGVSPQCLPSAGSSLAGLDLMLTGHPQAVTGIVVKSPALIVWVGACVATCACWVW